MDSAVVEALQAERSLCVRRGLKDRVVAIDAQLKGAGAQAPKAAATEPAVETAAVEAPETAARPRAARKTADK